MSSPNYGEKGPPQEELPLISEFKLFTSLRYDPMLADHQDNSCNDNEIDRGSPFYLLSFHLDRLLLSGKHFKFPVSRLENSDPRLQFRNWLLSNILNADPPTAIPAKVRILLDDHDNCTITTSSTPAVPLHALFPISLSVSRFRPSQSFWTVYLSETPTTPSSFTLHKTTHRPMYDEARSLRPASHPEDSEILLQNKEGEISEGSITTPYVYRVGHWITPPLSCGGNAGTTRRWALEQQLCAEGVMLATSLVDGEICWLSNGVRGFFPGRVHLLNESKD